MPYSHRKPRYGGVMYRGFESPRLRKGMTKKEIEILSHTYSNLRSKGNSKERAARISWSAVNKYHKSHS